MKKLIIFSAILMMALSASAQYFGELSVINGTSSARKSVLDTTVIGEQNYLGGNLRIYGQVSRTCHIGLTGSVRDGFSYFDTLGQHRNRFEAGLAFRHAGESFLNRSGDKNFIWQFGLSYFNDNKTNKRSYSINGGDPVVYNRQNVTDGAMINGKILLVNNENELKFLPMLELDGNLEIPRAANISAVYGKDSVNYSLTGEETARYFYRANFSADLINIPAGRKLGITLGGNAGVYQLNNFIFDSRILYWGTEIKLNSYRFGNSRDENYNDVFNIVKLGYRHSAYSGETVANEFFASLDLLGVVNWLAK